MFKGFFGELFLELNAFCYDCVEIREIVIKTEVYHIHQTSPTPSKKLFFFEQRQILVFLFV